jgi:hypothetical protein
MTKRNNYDIYGQTLIKKEMTMETLVAISVAVITATLIER